MALPSTLKSLLPLSDSLTRRPPRHTSIVSSQSTRCRIPLRRSARILRPFFDLGRSAAFFENWRTLDTLVRMRCTRASLKFCRRVRALLESFMTLIFWRWASTKNCIPNLKLFFNYSPFSLHFRIFRFNLIILTLNSTHCYMLFLNSPLSLIPFLVSSQFGFTQRRILTR